MSSLQPFRSRVPNTYGAILADLTMFDEALDRDLYSVELARSPAIPLRHVELEALMNVVVDHLGLGHLDEARTQLEALRARAGEGEQGRFRRITKLAWLDAELALAEGDAATAHDVGDAAAANAESSHMSKYAIRAALTRARALTELGERRDAVRDARSAAARADERGLATLAWQRGGQHTAPAAGTRTRDMPATAWPRSRPVCTVACVTGSSPASRCRRESHRSTAPRRGVTELDRASWGETQQGSEER